MTVFKCNPHSIILNYIHQGGKCYCKAVIFAKGIKQSFIVTVSNPKCFHALLFRLLIMHHDYLFNILYFALMKRTIVSFVKEQLGRKDYIL